MCVIIFFLELNTLGSGQRTAGTRGRKSNLSAEYTE